MTVSQAMIKVLRFAGL